MNYVIGDIHNELEFTASKQKLMEEFKKLSPEEKMDAIYELLLELK